MKYIKKFRRKARLGYGMAKVGLKALWSTKHPLLVHIVPTRRCNLACTYCDEYDDHSPPVPTDEMLARIDKIASLGTSMVSLSGGEPLLHPDLDDIIGRIFGHGMLAELLTNAYLLTETRIEALNAAGLNRLQVSIDNVKPDDISKKSLKVLDSKLKLLAEHATFDVNVNSVVGAGIDHPESALQIAKRARELGFSSTVGIIHDQGGQLKALNDHEQRIYEETRRFNSMAFSVFTKFKSPLAKGEPNQWRCRAGARYLYICEDGLVHRCSQQRGVPGIPLAEYGAEHFAREYNVAKSCAPYCTVSCVHAVAAFDNWRKPQRAVEVPHKRPQDNVRGGLRVIN